MDKKVSQKSHLYRPSATVDFLLTTVFISLVCYELYFLYKTNIFDLVIFCASCIGIYVAIKLTELFASSILRNKLSAIVLAKNPFNHPLKNERTYAKFEGTLWQFVIHTTMSLWELYILSDETWLEKPWTTYSNPWSFDYVPKASLRYFFIIQMAIWACTCFSHRFNSDAHMHKDYFPMYIHHLITITLVMIAYVTDHTRIGFIILYIHDFSDIGIDSLKFFNYLRLEGKSGFFLVEISYATALMLWIYFRLYIFPVHIIYDAALRIASVNENWLTIDGTTTYCSHLREVFGEDSFYFLGNYYGSVFGVGLLIALFLLHIWWFALLLRILIRLLQQANPHEAGAAEYEGYEDDHKEVARKTE